MANARVSQLPFVRRLLLTATLLLSVIFIGGDVATGIGFNAPPSEIGDGHDYDMIGFALSKGKGFAYDWKDPEFQAPYRQANGNGTYDDLLERTSRGTTAYRPPFIPAMIAVNHMVFGRQFWPARLFGVAAIALGITITVLIMLRRYGIVPAIIVMFYLLTSVDLRFYAGLISTEAPAFLISTLVLWSLLRFAQSPCRSNAIWTGALLGVGCLVRSSFALWLPVVVPATLVLARIRHQSEWRAMLAPPTLVFTAFMVISGPWMIRNCLVLQSFQPLGSMGAINMPAAYSEKAFENRGQWFNLYESGVFAPLRDSTLREDDALESEIVTGRFATRIAVEWIKAHPLEAAALPFLKAQSLWAGRMNQQLAILLAIGLAASLLLRATDAIVYATLLLSCTVSVALTWDVGDGRFLLPVQQIIAILVALGLWCLLVVVLELAVARLATASTDAKWQ